MAYLEQYKATGGDMAAYHAAYNAMIATGKTPLGLNQWQRSDKPMMEDFNEDNRIVDGKLRELDEGVRQLSEEKANITAPQVFDLKMLDSSIIHPNLPAKYWKNAFGEVTVQGEVIITDDAGFQAGKMNDFAELPVGFRPSYTVAAPITLRSAGGDQINAAPAMIGVNTNGVLSFKCPNTSFGAVRLAMFNFSFVAQ